MTSKNNTRNFICLVDAHTRPAWQRDTSGRYRVGALDPDNAREMLQQALGFGIVRIYSEDNTDAMSAVVPMGVCMKEEWNPSTSRFDHLPVYNQALERAYA